jgi:hypothetical protein
MLSKGKRIKLMKDKSLNFITVIVECQSSTTKEALDNPNLLLVYSNLGFLLLNFDAGIYHLSLVESFECKQIERAGFTQEAKKSFLELVAVRPRDFNVYYFDSNTLLFKKVTVDGYKKTGFRM